MLRCYVGELKLEMAQMVLVPSLAICGSQIYDPFSESLLSMDTDGMFHSETNMPDCVGFATGMSSKRTAPQSRMKATSTDSSLWVPYLKGKRTGGALPLAVLTCSLLLKKGVS